eukprot:Protomagalhaensia_sp_Gyna_25__1168@NODE_1575_length_1718_cov_19_363311_g1282_i0_p1_GENE_NODE_1575_length_1718_cov_19_363311_g1282_i0NODE_1575_length_1718_cov_19_363311_g1282_i0_p1_ORF_typecomplete_len156_score14_08Glutaredoxin/PF00462_24/3_9e06_NODE_1575_length_1718_cov_19_363311_g1282_i011811648
MRKVDLAPALGRTSGRSSRPLTGGGRASRRTQPPQPASLWLPHSRTPKQRELRPTMSAAHVSDGSQLFATTAPVLRPVASAAHSRAVMLVRDGCHYCAMARSMLAEHHVETVELPLPDAIRWTVLQAMVGRITVPQIWMDGSYVGGYEDLRRRWY